MALTLWINQRTGLNKTDLAPFWYHQDCNQECVNANLRRMLVEYFKERHFMDFIFIIKDGRRSELTMTRGDGETRVSVT